MKKRTAMSQKTALLFLLGLFVFSFSLSAAEQGAMKYRDHDNNPPGRVGGPGTNWENPPGPRGGTGASPDHMQPRKLKAMAENHPRLAKRIDTNNDGTIDDSEKEQFRVKAQEMRAKRLEQFDANGDGALDSDEKLAARKKWAEQHKQQRLENTNDGESSEDVTEQKHRAWLRERLKQNPDLKKRIDENGDGVIDRMELKKARRKWNANHPKDSDSDTSST